MAASDPRAPSKLPPPGTESTCEPIMIGLRPATAPSRRAKMLPAASIRGVPPAASMSFMVKARPARSASE